MRTIKIVYGLLMMKMFVAFKQGLGINVVHTAIH